MQLPIENIGLLKTAIEKELKKMSEEYFLKTSQSFRRCIDAIGEKKNGGHVE